MVFAKYVLSACINGSLVSTMRHNFTFSFGLWEKMAVITNGSVFSSLSAPSLLLYHLFFCDLRALRKGSVMWDKSVSTHSGCDCLNTTFARPSQTNIQSCIGESKTKSHPWLGRHWQSMAARGRILTFLRRCEPFEAAHAPVDSPAPCTQRQECVVLINP